MPQKAFRALAVAVLLCVGSNAYAGVYSDDLGKCLVRSTTSKDKTDLVRWIFANAALHPEVSSIASITDSQREAINRAAGTLIERLLTDSCRASFRDAMKYEGGSTMQLSFQVLGGAAMSELMSNSEVGKGFGAIEPYISKEKLEAVVHPKEP